ncbi:SEC10/PgrA surface exclusion domain-containing protein [Streptococcus infantis]|uniref:SEC10/PgrA surface exclusion domain-containing protein n=1 Tax=Streptococcus infantis TaxID=68892 RepID=UPI0039C45049
MKKLQTLTTSTAIALASVGGTAFAQEATTPVPSDTAVNEPALVTKPQVKPLEKSQVPAPSTVKPALDAQKGVVKDAEAKIETAKTGVQEKEATVASTEKEVATATQVVKDAEATASQATPAKIAEAKDAQAKNLEAQTANQEATEATNAQIKAETKVLAEKQSDVATAKENIDQAEKDVQTAEQTVANAESALDETGLANAENDLKDAQKGVKDAEATVTEAEDAFKTAKKADEAREDAIKSAETDVNTKNDAVKLAKEKLATANQHAESVDAKLQTTQDELTKAQDALKNVDIVNIQNPTFHISDNLRDKIGAKSNDITYKDAYELWRANDNETTRMVMRGMAVKMASASTIKISEADKNRPIDLNNLTNDQLVEISQFYAKLLTQLNHNFGYNASKKSYVSKETLDYSKSVAKKYEARALDPHKAGHIPGGLENLMPMGNGADEQTMYNLKQAVQRSFELSSFEDEPSKWEHLRTNLANQANSPVALSVANINGQYWMITTYAEFDNDTVIEDKTDIATLEKAVATAESNLEQAKTASENAKNALTTASTDYASALSLKTEAEKVLADAMATPLQAQVAENNLRLANIALENAKKRETQASEAVANFSASLADKKSALEKAQDALKEAKTVQTIASQALENASAKLEDQETKLDNLNKQVTKLLAEKDALVKEAKELAEQLQAYLDAPVALANAKQARTAVSVKLELAKSDLETAQSKLENLLTAQKAEEAKLAELEATYDNLVDLAEKAQENVVATLPDGTVIAVPKVAPTAEVLPELNLEELAKEDAKGNIVKTLPDGTIVAVPKDAPVAETLPTVNVDELKKALDAGKEVTLDAQGNVVVRETKPATYEKPVNVDRLQANNDKSNKAYASDKNVTIDNKGNVITKGQTYTSQQQASSKSTYSRVERAKTLPNTGESSSVTMLVLGAILGTFGLVTVRRKN